MTNGVCVKLATPQKRLAPNLVTLEVDVSGAPPSGPGRPVRPGVGGAQ